ncbi:MAG: vitamin K epoxide reductase family protein [archaeon]|nr:vitamin K epoxide reductase family protein [archaeon]
MLDYKRWIYVALAVGGTGDAIYDAWEYLTQSFNSCSIKNTIFSCGGVAGSGHTSIALGQITIPFWTTGLVWFPLSLIIGVVAFKYYAEVILIPFVMIGNIFTIYLWYLELGVIHLICLVCLSLYVINYALTGTAIWIAVT